MPDRKIKRQRHPAKSFSKSPLPLYFLAPLCPRKGPGGLTGQDPRSTIVERALQIRLFFAKQTQSNPIPPSYISSTTRIAASRPIESRQFCRYRPNTLHIPVFSQKTQERAVLGDFMGRPEDIARRRGTFFGSFAAGGMFPIL